MTVGEKAIVTEYTAISADRRQVITDLKKLAAAYYDAVDAVEQKYGRQRDFSIAKTHIQDASMWATRGLANPE